MKRLLLLVLLLALVGCGGKGAKFGPYSIGRDQTWYPLQINLLGPNVNAFTNALVQEIANIEHVPLQLIDVDWVQLFQILETREVAGIFTSLSPNIVNQEQYTFSDPFLYLGPVLIVPANSNATSLLDLEGKIVSVYQFDESVLIAQNYPLLMIRLYQNKPIVLEQLSRGEIDGVLMPILDAQALVSSLYPKQLKIVTGPLNNKALRLITLKNSNQSLLKHFNRGLAKVISSGKYQKLRRTFELI